MARETRDSALKRIIRSRREAVPNPGVTDISINARASKFICKNSGTVPIRINFGTDPSPQYFQLEPGESLPDAIEVSDRVVMHVRAVGAASEIQLILWS